MKDKENSSPPPLVVTDCLTDIKSLEPAHQKVLNASGIYSYSQLARLTPRDILETFRQQGTLVSREIISYWIHKARQKAASPKALPSPPPKNDNKGTAEQAVAWEEITSFYISFQARAPQSREGHSTRRQFKTYIDHIDSNHNQSWSGLQLDGPCRWIKQRLKDSLHSQTKGEPPSSADLPLQKALDGCKVILSDPTGGIAVCEGKNHFSGTLEKNSPVRMQLQLQPHPPAITPPPLPDLNLSLYYRQKKKKQWQPIKGSTPLSFSSDQGAATVSLDHGFNPGLNNLLLIFSNRDSGESIHCREIKNLRVL